jgi:DNA mismatch endonuclease (patch repair protein)
MSRIRGKNTRPEIALRGALWSIGLRYRLHAAISGRPDIVFRRRRVAVFVDGCFWHGCPRHGVRPKTNTEFWRDKLDKNIARDKKVTASLQAEGWTVIRIWEHQVRQNISKAVERVLKAVGGAASGSNKGSRT